MQNDYEPNGETFLTESKQQNQMESGRAHQTDVKNQGEKDPYGISTI